ncbi:L-glutamate gamma-semialdehyde dehydrogenase, partial [Nocardioides sp.]|uniref:L-glutamate gamma-semialdehyde dehydrogenase n=1 Tax=Nocardioides sp. TaxID=35761 RepID=UPI0027358714
MDAVTQVPAPTNEPINDYAPGSPERSRLELRLKELAEQEVELTATIGGAQRPGGGEEIDVVQPHDHAHRLGVLRNATQDDARAATAAAQEAAPAWRALSFDDRAAILLKAADLLSGPWRDTLNAATMLGQSKTAIQAEIDSACELIDFWRFNVAFGRQLLAEQPMANAPGVWNRLDHRPLEGFVYAISPFNFTAIAGNLPTAPALMGNTVVWKPSPTQQVAAHHTMRLLEAAGMPPGVINMLPGDGIAVSEVTLADPALAGIHFTGSTPTFQHLWRTVGTNIDGYHSYPRLVGETGGKDFVLAHPSADPDVVATALLRGAFEYQGQKCSAASRAYVARSVWQRMRDQLVDETEGLVVGDVRDLGNFMGAVIDDRAFAKHKAAIDRAHADPSITVIAGGTYDDSVGYFVRPTILECTDPENEVFTTEYFGPILAVHVYDDADYHAVLAQMESASPYGLTGAVIAQDRTAINHASDALRFAAGNFYVNDKPTGAVVGQQPFGGARGSGTNDKAGSAA